MADLITIVNKDYTVVGSATILEECSNSPHPCVVSKVEGAYRVVYEPLESKAKMHTLCFLLLFI